MARTSVYGERAIVWTHCLFYCLSSATLWRGVSGRPTRPRKRESQEQEAGKRRGGGGGEEETTRRLARRLSLAAPRTLSRNYVLRISLSAGLLGPYASTHLCLSRAPLDVFCVQLLRAVAPHGVCACVSFFLSAMWHSNEHLLYLEGLIFSSPGRWSFFLSFCSLLRPPSFSVVFPSSFLILFTR